MNRYKLTLWILITCIFSSCKEFNTTQNEKLTITTTGSYITPADGETLVKITANSDRLISIGQKVTFTTTRGTLHRIFETDFSNGVKILTFEPQDYEFSIWLKPGLIPDPNVILTARVNHVVTDTKFQFARVCPESIELSNFDQPISLSNGKSTEIGLELINSTNQVSKGTKLEVSSDNPNIAIVNSSFEANNELDTINVILSGDTGIVSIRVNTNPMFCPSFSESIELEIKN